MAHAEATPGAGCLVVSSVSDGIFSAGADVSDFVAALERRIAAPPPGAIEPLGDAELAAITLAASPARP